VGRPAIICQIIALSILTLFGSPLSAEEVHLVLLHTNDIHGHFRASKSRHGDSGMTGGMARLATAVGRVRKAEKGIDGVLLLDGGDIFHGYPESDASRGLVLIRLMNRVGYDVAVPGNHDFAYGLTRLGLLVKEARFPFVACNVRRRQGGALPAGLQAWVVREVAGVRIGFTGFTTPAALWFNLPANVQGIEILSARRVLAAALADLKSRCDVLVLLSHAGLRDDYAMAFKFPGIHVIVGGHTHTLLNPAKRKGGTLVCQAGCFCRRLGRVDLVYDKTRHCIVSLAGRLISLDKEVPPDPAVAAMVREFEDASLDEIIGTITQKYGRRSMGDSPATRLITEAMRVTSGADVAMLNHGSVAAGLRTGPVTRRDCLLVAPYDEAVTLYTVTGAELKKLLESLVYNGHPSVGLSGVRFTYNLDLPKMDRVTEAVVGGAGLDPKRNYRLASTWYLARRGGPFSAFLRQGRDLAQAPGRCLVSYIEKRRKIDFLLPPCMFPQRMAPLAAGERIDVNCAPEKELVRLPGVGPGIAKSIVRTRREIGGFRTARDLLKVKGIGERILRRIEPHILLPTDEQESPK
jgi:competence ComEA-like helix-hairpin-helix protein